MRGVGKFVRRAILLSLAASLLSSSTVFSPTAFAQSTRDDEATGSPLDLPGVRSENRSQSDRRDRRTDSEADNQSVQTVIGSDRADDRDAPARGRTDAGDSDLLASSNPRIKPPADPGEFERWARDVTGRKLKRFGADLLLPSNRDYAVPAASTVPPDYALNIGDTVSIALSGSIEGSADFEIDRDGRIYLPQVGPVRLAGVRYRDLKDRVASVVGTKYRGFEVAVSVKELRGVRVYVTGFANNPGAYTVNSLSTLVNAVLAAGGPSAGGSFRSVKLYRNGSEVVDFDLYDLIRRGDKSRDPLLQNEDVLFIPPAGRQVVAIGSVNEEAIYEVRPGETIEDLLRLAGGPTNLADTSRVIVYRLRDRDTDWSRQLTRAAAAAEPVEPGDVVQLLPLGSLVRPLERQSNIVRIEGEVSRPGNYYVAPNTPLSTVIEMAGGLTSRAYVYGTVFSRESVRAQQRESYREAVNQLETVLVSAPLTQDRTIDAGERQTQLAAARAFLDKLRQTEPDGRLVLDLTPGTTALPGHLLVENNDHIIVPPRVDTVGVFGAVYRPASFLLGNGGGRRKIGDYVEQAGGTIRAADRGNIFVVHANGEVVTKRRGALSASALPGDVVFVPIKTQSSSLLAKIRDISTIIFQLGLSAAAVAAIQ